MAERFIVHRMGVALYREVYFFNFAGARLAAVFLAPVFFLICFGRAVWMGKMASSGDPIGTR
jgi:hypothetical protein